MKTLLTLLGIALVSLSGFLGYQVSKPDTFGAFRPSGYSGKLLTRLNSGGAESSFNTTPCTTPDGQTIIANAIGDFIVITVNPGASNEEKISASTVSCSGTTLTWTIANRGLSFASATSTITANKKQHAIGETVIISNDDQFLATQYVDIDSTQIIAALKTFTLGALFSTAASSTDECTAGNEYCTKTYIDNSVNQGAATSTESTGGIVELATQIEMASSTDYGSTRPLVLQAKYATSTTDVRGLYVPVAQNDGYLKQSWFDLTKHFLFSSLFATNASSTNATTTNLHITSLASSFLYADANGRVQATSTVAQKFYLNTATAAISASQATTTIFAVSVPANTLSTSNAISCKLYIPMGSATNLALLKLQASYGGIASSTILTSNIGGGSGNVLVENATILLSAAGAASTQKLSLSAQTYNDATFIGSIGTKESTPNIDSTVAQPLIFMAQFLVQNGSIPAGQVVCTLIR
jgi:hypothetical protein